MTGGSVGGNRRKSAGTPRGYAGWHLGSRWVGYRGGGGDQAGLLRSYLVRVDDWPRSGVRRPAYVITCHPSGTGGKTWRADT